MAESRVYVANTALKLSQNGGAVGVVAPPATTDLSSAPAEGKYIAISPNGNNVQIPKELYIALLDFIKTRKYPGSINIQFRSGEIICVEAVAKKTYR